MSGHEYSPLHRAGRLTARPADPRGDVVVGSSPLGLGMGRDGLRCVPRQARAGAPLPLIVMLHGAGGAAHGGSLLARLAEVAGAVLLVPESRASTWDVIHGGFGPDVAFIDAALAATFAACPIDPARVTLAGFSDGASYALSLGLTNGDLFTHLVALAPGFVAPGALHGTPPIFIAHGTADRVLPIERCSRRIVPRLRGAHYRVDYHEFAGGHVVPPLLALRALRWLRRAPAGGP